MRSRYTPSGMLLLFATFGLLAAPLCADNIEDTQARLAKVGDADKYNADAVVVLDSTDVDVQPNGIGVAHYRRIVKILRGRGYSRPVSADLHV